MDKKEDTTPEEIIIKQEDHKHNFVQFSDSSAIFCTICGIQHMNITRVKLSVERDDSEDKHLRLASLIPLVQKIQCLSASSIYDPNHDVTNSILNYIPETGKSGSWCAKVNDDKQWIRLDCKKNYKIYGVAIQGRHDNPQWVTEFKLYAKADKGKEEFFIGQFSGNDDRETIVEHVFTPRTARYIRLMPFGFNNHVSLRWEVYGEEI